LRAFLNWLLRTRTEACREYYSNADLFDVDRFIHERGLQAIENLVDEIMNVEYDMLKICGIVHASDERLDRLLKALDNNTGQTRCCS